MIYQALLVPLDGSPWSEHAVSTAATIAEGAGAAVHLVHVLPQRGGIVGALPVHDTPSDPQQREQAEAYLTSVAYRLREQAIHVRTSVLAGPVAPALQAYVTRHAIALAMMTTHGRSERPLLWFGSVADQLVRALPTPIVLLRPAADSATDQAPRPIRHILIPLDGSTLAENCIDHALALGTLTQARYTLLHVVEHLPPAGQNARSIDAFREQTLGAAEHAAASYLDGVAAGLSARAPLVQIAVITGRPSELIPAYAAQHEVDLITMSTHGRSGFARWYFGSVTTSVLRTSPTPLLLSKTQHAAQPRPRRP